MALNGAGAHDEALVVLRRSLSLRRTAYPALGPADARALEAQAWALQRKGAYPEARAVVADLGAALSTLPADHALWVEASNIIGLQAWFEGDLGGARLTAERAASLGKAVLRPDHPSTARAIRYLADVTSDLGDLNRAHMLRLEALLIAERAYGPSHHETGGYINNVGWSEFLRGNYAAAQVQFERALRIAETSFGPWHDRVATAIHNLALVDAGLGDYARARTRQARATAIWERTLGKNHPFVAVALAELAAVARESGSPSEAQRLLTRALSIRERSLGPTHRDVATTLADLAGLSLRAGNRTRARMLTDQALAIWHTLGVSDAPDYATVLVIRGDLQLAQGNARDAEQDYMRALEIRQRVFGPDHPAVAETLSGLAHATANLGQYAAALDDAARAEDVGRDHLRLMVASLPERQSLEYARTRPKGLDLMLSLIGTAPGVGSRAFDAAIKSRALVLDEMAARQRRLAGASGVASPAREAFESARQRLANLVVRGPGELPPNSYGALVDEARAESERAERAFAEESTAFRASIARAQVGVSQLTDALPPDSAMVSFVRYERTRWVARAAGATRPVRAASYIGLVLRKDWDVIAVDLGSADTIDTLVRRWREDIATEAAVAASSDALSRVSGTAVRRQIWDPLAAGFEGAHRVFVVPDGMLSLVPFAALPVRRSSFLVEFGPLMHYLSAERDLLDQPDRDRRSGLGLLAVGSPSFDMRPKGSTRSGQGATSQGPIVAAKPAADSLRSGLGQCGLSLDGARFGPLAGTLREVEELEAIWHAAGAEPARVLVGPEATEGALKRDASRYRVLHLATHGFVLGDECGPNLPGTRAVGGLAKSPSNTLRPARVESPLLRSGLALAGANYRTTAGANEDDGILTAEEVAGMDLSGVEWAVLSACDTGVGAVQVGEGVLGLRRAFQIAGARTVVMSLWAVSDQAARQWMRALYEARFKGQATTADAMQSAHRSILRERRRQGRSASPFYWAAFAAAGDWR